MNFIERKDPIKFEFGEGVRLDGILIKVERVKVRDSRTDLPKDAVRYIVEESESGEAVFFFGTHQLDGKIRPVDIGHYVRIICEGEDTSVSRNGNAMKVFKVFISERTAPGWANNGTPITNEDIGF